MGSKREDRAEGVRGWRETRVNEPPKKDNHGEKDNALLLDLDAGQKFLLQYIGLIEEQDQMDMSQEGAGTDCVERLERVVDPVHLGTSVRVNHDTNRLWCENAAHHGVRYFALVSPFWLTDFPASSYWLLQGTLAAVRMKCPENPKRRGRADGT